MSDVLTRDINSIHNLIENKSDEYIESFEERYWEKVEKGDGCWLWQASTGSHGYGQITFRGSDDSQKILLAHRISLYLSDVGSEVDQYQTNHICHNKKCVNPDHLYLGSQQDNVDDSIEAGLVGLGTENVSGKLTNEEVREVREKYEGGDYTQYDLAEKYGITQTHVWRIVNDEARNR